MDRYIKQMNFKGIGREGQQRLKNSRVLIVGCGALGTVVANSLARTGVGHIRIVDRDFVELTNLHRQTLFNEADAKNSIPKAEAAKEYLQKVNSDILIEAIIKDFNSITSVNLIKDIDIILDCTDNFKTRYLINDIAFSKGIPWIYGGAVGSTGVVKCFIPHEEEGCFRCIMNTPPSAGAFETCDTAGVINTSTGIVAMLQANEAIKYLTGNKEVMEKSMIYLDLWDNVFEKIQLKGKEDCPCCKKKNYQYLEDKLPEALYMCGSNSVQIDPNNRENISLDVIKERLEKVGIKTKKTSFLLNIWAEKYEIKLFNDGRAIIKNASTIEEAKGVYSRYIGY